MPITDVDRATITDLISQHGHLIDSGRLDRLSELFTEDVHYDLTDLGQPSLHGLAAIPAAARALGAANPVGHHVTNVVLAEAGEREVRATSKGIGIMADGTCASVTYEDTLVHGDAGWRISYRRIRPHRAPLGGS